MKCKKGAVTGPKENEACQERGGKRKKRILTIALTVLAVLLVAAVVLFLIPYVNKALGHADESNGLNAKKKLTQVIRTDSNGNVTHKWNFTYDENNLLTNYSVDWGLMDDFPAHEETRYRYNENGQLTLREYTTSRGSTYEYSYSYNSAGQLTKCSSKYNNEQETEYVLEYDAQGRLIKRNFVDYMYSWDGIREYTYNDAGQIASASLQSGHDGDYSFSECQYFYNSLGQLVEERRKNADSDKWTKITYSYDYYPFILQNGEELSLEDPLATIQYFPQSISVSSPTFRISESTTVEMEKGYLVKLTDDQSCYRFFYDGEVPNDKR